MTDRANRIVLGGQPGMTFHSVTGGPATVAGNLK